MGGEGLGSPEPRFQVPKVTRGRKSKIPEFSESREGTASYLRLCLFQRWGILSSRIGYIPRPPRLPLWWGIPRLCSSGRWKLVLLVFPGTPGANPTNPNSKSQLCPQPQAIPEWPASRRASHSSPARASGGSMFPAVAAVTEPG